MTASEIISRGVEYISKVSNYFVNLLNLSATSGKILNVIILLGLLYGAIKVGEKPLRILIIILTIILLIQVLTSYL